MQHEKCIALEYADIVATWARAGPLPDPVILSFFPDPGPSFMAKPVRNNNRQSRPAAAPTPFEEARDELFQHIMQCGVVGAEAEDQTAWFDETMGYLTARYPELGETEHQQLRTLGERFAQPPKARQQQTSAA
jgi:hypothetical protein